MQDGHRKKDAGVTLLEVLVVLAILAMIAAIAAPRLLESFGRAKSQAATMQMSNLKASIQLFYIDVGRYPTEAEGLGALVKPPAGLTQWAGPYAEAKSLEDPWGRTYIYRQPGAETDFDLMTLGRDGLAGGQKEDRDITF